MQDQPTPLLDQHQAYELLECIQGGGFYALDAEWRFTYINPKAEQFWGRNREGLLGKSIWNEFPQGVHTQAYTEMHRALAEQATVRFETFSAFLDSWQEVEAYPTAGGLAVYFHDITQRKQAEAALLASQHQLRLITDSLPALVSYVDAEMRYQFVNKGYEEWFNLDRDHIIGRPVAAVIGQTAFERVKPDLEAVLGGSTVEYEREMPYATGPRFTHTQLFPHRRADGTVAGIVAMEEDITVRKRDEEALARLAAIVTSSNDAIVSETLDGIITSWNQGAEKVFGYAADEVIGKPLTLLVPPEIADEETLLLEKFAAGEPLLHYDTIRLRKDGSRVFVSVTPSPLKDAQDKIVGFAKIAHDVTERKQAEERLPAGEEKFAKVFHAAPMSLMITRLADGRIVEVNEAVVQLTGFLREEALGRTPVELGLWVEPENWTQGLTQLRAGHHIDNSEERFRMKDGRILTCLVAAEVIEINGEPAVVTVIKDITERKQAEEKQRRDRERLAALNRLARAITSDLDLNRFYDNFVNELLALIPLDRTAIVLLNETGDQWWIDRQWTRYQPAILPGERRPVQGSVIERLVATRAPFLENEIGEHETWPETAILQREGIRSRFLQPLILQDRVIGVLTAGSRRPAAFSVEEQALLSSIADQLVTAIFSSQLFEQVKRHAAQLEQHVAERTAQLETANKELEAFSYSVSHDLRAPLRSVDGFSRIVLRDYAAQLPAPAQRYLQLVHDGAQQMGRLIDDLLAFSRLSRQPFNRQSVALGGMVRQVLAELSSEQENRQVEITIGDLPACSADPALLKQVFVNLLANALKFTQRCAVAHIEVGCLHEDGEEVIYIKDNGAGFDMAYADKLFGVFQRLHRADEYPGTGVGLAIVQRIVHRHGGRIWATAAVDQGATFYFTFQEGTSHG